MLNCSYLENRAKICFLESLIEINSFPISSKSIASKASLCTFNIIRLLSLNCVIVVRRYDFTRRRVLKDCSQVAFVAGMTKINSTSITISEYKDLAVVDNDLR